MDGKYDEKPWAHLVTKPLCVVRYNPAFAFDDRVRVLQETEKAILISQEGQMGQYWIPKSKIKSIIYELIIR